MYYFANIPHLPPSVHHQSGMVEVLKYLVKEGDNVPAGAPLMRVQNWWAIMEIDASGAGVVSKTFFTRGTHVNVGDPFAIIACDPEDRPRTRTEETCILRIIERVREKPGFALDV